jgi:hypothetical protein
VVVAILEIPKERGTQMARIANYEINSHIQKFQPFVNYNGTITAEIDEKGVYRIVHWRTTVLEYDVYNHRIISLADGYISQTTSTLVGRILRSLPKTAVENFLGYYSPSPTKRRLVRMLNIRYSHTY